MKYSIPYNKFSKYKNDVDELIVLFPKNLRKSIPFFENHKHQNIILKVSDIVHELSNSAEALLAPYKENITLQIEKDDIEKIHTINEKKKNPWKFLLSDPAQDWDQLYGILSEGVSEIAITNTLAFDIERVSNVCHNSNVKIRIIPNMVQSSYENFQSLYTFWIRPEDIDLYNEYIDTVEIKSGAVGDYKYIDMVYNVYTKDKKWFGNLKELIRELDIDIDSRYLLPTFGIKRLRCRKKCLSNPDSCHSCDISLQTSEVMKEKNIIFKKNRR